MMETSKHDQFIAGVTAARAGDKREQGKPEPWYTGYDTARLERDQHLYETEKQRGQQL